MGNYGKSIIAPIIGVIALGVGALTGVTIADDVIDQVVGLIGMIVSVGLTVYGIFKNHEKDPQK